MAFAINTARELLQGFRFGELFLELGWGRPAGRTIAIGDLEAKPIAELAGVVVFEVTSQSGEIRSPPRALAATGNTVDSTTSTSSSSATASGARPVLLGARRGLETDADPHLFTRGQPASSSCPRWPRFTSISRARSGGAHRRPQDRREAAHGSRRRAGDQEVLPRVPGAARQASRRHRRHPRRARPSVVRLGPAQPLDVRLFLAASASSTMATTGTWAESSRRAGRAARTASSPSF